jgi:hypothetical protein
MLVSAEENSLKPKPRKAIPLFCMVVHQVVLKTFAKTLLHREAGVIGAVIAIEDGFLSSPAAR